MVTFDDTDAYYDHGHRDALVVTLSIGNFLVYRVLIVNGNLAKNFEIMLKYRMKLSMAKCTFGVRKIFLDMWLLKGVLRLVLNKSRLF